MLAVSDLPDLANLQDKLANADFSSFPTLREKLIHQVCIYAIIP